ncbi:MAG TPA: hypothetical protein VMU33_12720 [Burkholderiaceae bacterium]|nr:hypothetical protein [Burkholderiaceae bacterium]
MAINSANIAPLIRKREALLKELGVINEQLLRTALDTVHASVGALPAGLGKGVKGDGAPKGKRRSWFERGEALALSKKILTKPMTQADLVRALASAKGYTKGLAATDQKRFQSAAYQAIANGIGARKLVQLKDGKVSAR